MPGATSPARSPSKRVSLPWLADAMVLNGGDGPIRAGGVVRGAVRPGPGPARDRPRRPDGAPPRSRPRPSRRTGRGFDLGFGSEGLSIRDFTGGLAGGRLTGGATLARQGGQGDAYRRGGLTAASLTALTGGDAVKGQVSLRLRLGAAGDSPAALVGNLAGSGALELAGLSVRDLDPAASHGP